MGATPVPETMELNDTQLQLKAQIDYSIVFIEQQLLEMTRPGFQQDSMILSLRSAQRLAHQCIKEK